MKPSLRTLTLTWLLLVVLTLAGAGLGGGASPGLGLTLIVATITALKGGLVIEEFLEVGGATPGIRYPVRVFGYWSPSAWSWSISTVPRSRSSPTSRANEPELRRLQFGKRQS